MSGVKGNFSRKIKAPGNHIRPKYDLHGLREYKLEKKKKSQVMDLNLTPFIDLFSVLVIFLILNYSATGEVFFISKNLTLPATEHSHPLESKPLITITDRAVLFDAQEVGTNTVHIEEQDQLNMPQLRRALQQAKAFQQTLRPNQEFKGEVNIQADQGISIVYIKRVMNTLITEGWSGINFATRLIEPAPSAEASTH
jgi:biopolymer transport protein ExbD